jgi:hypothetical protein
MIAFGKVGSRAKVHTNCKRVNVAYVPAEFLLEAGPETRPCQAAG